MRLGTLAAIAAVALFTSYSFAAQNSAISANPEHSTPVDRVLAKAFPMTELSDCGKDGEKISAGALTIEIGGQIHIQGVSATGKKWSASWDYAPVSGCGIYRADLEGNGRQDLIVFTPEIDSGGAYHSFLTLLMMDADGEPTPWRIMGAFRMDEQGIAEIVQDGHGKAIILDTVQIGHASWGGVSTGYVLYRIADGRIDPVKGSYLGITWPYLPKNNPDNPGLAKMIGQQDISMRIGQAEAHEQSDRSTLRVLRYGAVVSQSSPAQPQEIPPGMYPTVDIGAMDADKKYLILSDDSKMDLPSVVIFDRADGNREIVFEGDYDTDAGQITQLWKKPFTVRSLGTQCFYEEECQPFLLWATADSGKDGE